MGAPRPGSLLFIVASWFALACGETNRDEWSLEPTHVRWKERPLDVLLVVGDAPGLAPAQERLATSLERLAEVVTTRRCRDGVDRVGPFEACPAGQMLGAETLPFAGVKIGVLSASLAVPGSDVCANDAADPEARSNGRLRSIGADGAAVSTATSTGHLEFRVDAGTPSDYAARVAQFGADVGAVVGALGEGGCPIQSPLEAWYRFLFEPAPRLAGSDVPDLALLEQRAAFYTPGDATMLVMLSDRDDCSVADPGAGAALGDAVRAARDAAAATALCSREALLHPVDRYTGALACSAALEPDLPLCNGLGGTALAIVGVPEVDLPSGPAAPGARPRIDWDLVLGEGVGAPPRDPFMRASILPRVGDAHPVTGEAPLSAAESLDSGVRVVNGHEHERDDALQMACVAALPTPRPCADLDVPCVCEVGAAGADPRCDDTFGVARASQYALGATPGLRQLTVLRDAEVENAIAGSICQSDDPALGFFAPLVDTWGFLERYTQDSSCPAMPETIPSRCELLVATRLHGVCSCDAPGLLPVRSSALAAQVLDTTDPGCRPGQVDCGAPCVCTLKELQGAEAEICATSDAPFPTVAGASAPVQGWCSVDATSPLAALPPSAGGVAPCTGTRAVFEPPPEAMAHFVIACPR